MKKDPQNAPKNGSKPSATSDSKRSHDGKVNQLLAPLSSNNLFDQDDEGLQARIQELTEELAPLGADERLLFDRLVIVLRRLHRLNQNAPDFPDAQWIRLEAMTSREFWKAHAELHKLKARHRKEAAERSKNRTLPEVPDEAFEDWRERIVIDPQVSRVWPVVKGTDLEAEYICSMIEDDWTYDDIREKYPQLRESDIRACLECESEGKGGRWEGGLEPITPQFPDGYRRPPELDYPFKPKPSPRFRGSG